MSSTGLCRRHFDVRIGSLRSTPQRHLLSPACRARQRRRAGSIPCPGCGGLTATAAQSTRGRHRRLQWRGARYHPTSARDGDFYGVPVPPTAAGRRRVRWPRPVGQGRPAAVYRARGLACSSRPDHPSAVREGVAVEQPTTSRRSRARPDPAPRRVPGRGEVVGKLLTAGAAHVTGGHLPGPVGVAVAGMQLVTTLTADQLATATATNPHGEFAAVVATADLPAGTG